MVRDSHWCCRHESQQGFDWLFRRVKERMEQNHTDMDINFSVMVLGTNFWPLNPPKDGFIVPTDIQITYRSFPTEILLTKALRSETDPGFEVTPKMSCRTKSSEPKVHSYDERISDGGATVQQQ